MVYQKIHEIMVENKLIQKDGKIEMGSKGSYTVLTERKVLEVLRPAFIEKKLVIVPQRIEHLSRMGSVTTLGMVFTIIDLEDKHEIEVSSVGQGSSTGDKGAGSAFTYALKYLLMKITMMMSGDDPDQIGDEEHDDEAKENEAFAIKLAQEVSSLISGKMITPEIGNGMIKYLEENKNDPAILKDAERQLNEMKAGAQNE
jgi:hypothetical protein